MPHILATVALTSLQKHHGQQEKPEEKVRKRQSRCREYNVEIVVLELIEDGEELAQQGDHVGAHGRLVLDEAVAGHGVRETHTDGIV